MKYYNAIFLANGIVHSIDMVYVQYFFKITINGLLEELRVLRDKYPNVKYDEYLERPKHSKYDFFRDGVVFGTSFFDLGKYVDYNRDTKEYHLLPVFQIRVNPNKCFDEIWYSDLINFCNKFGSSGYLRKYDYAIDIPLSPSLVKVFKSRKELGLYKGTRYFGQSGRHNYCKIYDKQADMERHGVSIEPLTRVEYTLFSNREPSFEKVYFLLEKNTKVDLSQLNETDRAIVLMYRELKALGVDFELELGRRKMEKLNSYLVGDFIELEYGDCLERLLDNIKNVFHCSSNEPSNDDFLLVFSDEPLPFD